MNIGDKVRFKGMDPLLPKGSIGVINNVDYINDNITVLFDKIVLHCTPQEFKELMELIIDVKIPCPLALVKWYKACTKYIGRRDD